MSRFSRYDVRAQVNYEQAQQQHVRDLMTQVAELKKERDIMAEELRNLRGLTLAYRYQVKHPGTSLDAAIEATRGVIPREEKQG